MNKKIAMLLGYLWGFASVMAQTPESEWKIGYVSRLGEPARPCIGPNCKKAQQDFVSKLTKVCMYRDKASSGLVTRGNWMAVVNSPDKKLCQDVLFADIPAKVLYLEAPLMKSTGAFLAGQQYIHCTPDDGRGESNLCSPARPMYCKNPALEAKSSGYDACSSEFFTPYAENPRYRVLQPNSIGQAVRESKLIAAIDQHVVSEAKRAADEEVTAYHSAFENAKTLDSIKTFELKYANNDPEGLIAKLADLKRGLQLEQYRQRFASMRDIGEIESFISDYANDDPDAKLPAARRRLVEEQRKAATEAKRVADDNATNEKAKNLSELERQIIWCKRESVSARQTIEHENKIGRVSGYVNKMVLRQAGEIIVSCDETMPRNFAQYKRLGGMRSMTELK
jgi:hypothetical protein